MPYSNWSNGVFIDATAMNLAEALTQQGLTQQAAGLHTPGVVNATAVTFSSSGLFLTTSLPAPFAVLFSSGTYSQGHGTTNGSDVSDYTINMASLVPGDGSAIVYLLARHALVGLAPVDVVGPPVGHPDYDPAFAPFVLYSEIADTIDLAASLIPADNLATVEIGRFTLSAGATTVPAVDISRQIRAGAVLSRSGEVLTADLAVTGVVPGNYRLPTLTVGADGRLTAVANVKVATGDLVATGVVAGPYISPDLTIGADGRIVTAVSDNLLVKDNLWTGTNTHSNPITLNNSIALRGTDSGGTAHRMLQYSSDNHFDLFGGAAGFRLWNYTGSGTLLTVDNFGDLYATGGLVVGGLINAGGSILANGNITASGGSLRATYGAATGDLNAAVILNDFPFTGSYLRLPNGVIFQYGIYGISGGQQFQVPFPLAWPNFCFTIVASFGGNKPPTAGAVGADQIDRFTFITANTAPGGGPFGVHWMAVGY